MPKLSVQPFQAETFDLPNEIVRKITKHFAVSAKKRSVLMLEQLLGENGRFNLGYGGNWHAGMHVCVYMCVFGVIMCVYVCVCVGVHGVLV